MSKDWENCSYQHECIEGNRFGKGCVEDPLQNAMGGKPWHECHCGIDGEGNPPNVRQASVIAMQADEIERLRAALEIMSMMGGYTKLHPDDAAPSVEQNTYSWGVSEGYKEMAEMARAALEASSQSRPNGRGGEG